MYLPRWCVFHLNGMRNTWFCAQVMSADAYAKLKEQMDALPEGVK
jgi:hypothetical protein